MHMAQKQAEPSTESRARARTRNAIIDAAIATLRENPAASLGDVAAAAGVGRTTVHRYFPERADLLNAIGARVLEQIQIATERARPHDGPAPAALDRLCQEYFEVGDGLSLMFENPQLIAWEGWQEETPADRALLDLLRRGRRAGAFDPEMSPEWIVQALWALLFAAWSHAREDGVTRHTALTMCLRSLHKMVGTAP